MKKILDWSAYHEQGMGDAYADIPKHGEDFAKAIAVCIRSGICQQPDNRGVMCPSFKISNAPQLSPGGRVLLFKELLNQDDQSFLKDPALAEALEHCVSCKGCKRECESNLDMAAIKAEYLAQKHRAGMGTRRSRLFAEFPFLLYKYPALNWLAKRRNKSGLLKKLGKTFLGVSDQVTLPERAEPRPFTYQSPTTPNEPSEPHRSVVLLVDAFTALFEPQIAQDAQAVLEAGGYKVQVILPQSAGGGKLLESGRSLFSNGLIKRSGEQAAHLLEFLMPYVEAGHRIIGLEPSALLMLRDEFLMLHLGEGAQKLAAQSLLFEEFLAKELAAKRFALEFEPYKETGPVLVQGHCHQKAVGGMKAMRKALRLIPDLPFSFLEVSCCGMAGSYGMEAEHAKQSQAMAQLQLLPQLDAAPEALVVSNGFSCNQQIRSLRGRVPIHLATLLRRHMAPLAKPTIDGPA